MVGSPTSPRTIGSPGWALERSDRAVEAPVRLVGRPGVGGGFGEVEEGVDVVQRRLVDVCGLDRLEVLAGEGRIGRVDDEPDAGRGEGAGGDQVKSRRLTQLGELAVQYGGVRQDDAPLPWPEVGESRVEILGDHAAVEPVDHPVAEADRQDARRMGSGRRGEFGADGGEGAGHPVGSRPSCGRSGSGRG